MNRDNLVKLYNEIVSEASLERKGKTMPYTSANGHMFSFINKDNEKIGIRLSKEDIVDFYAKYNAKPFMSHGATMKGYVLIHKNLYQDKTELVDYLKKQHQYVMSLPKK